MKSHLQSYPCPLQINAFWNVGFLLGIAIMLQIVTGIFLALHYTSDLNSAYFSIFFLIREVYYGWSLRYFHSNGASFVFLFLFLHIARAIFYGSYFYNPNTWFSGILLFFLLMAIAFMGYVLPWGQMSFWGATVITNLFSVIPVVGTTITEWLWGGFAVDNATLKRFFSLHYLMPFMIFGVVILHIWSLHVTGNNNPVGVSVKEKQDTVPFAPYYTVKDAFSLVCFLILFAWFIFFNPNILGHTDNYIMADPLVTPAHIVPEWYLLPFYAILRAIPSKLGGVLVMGAAIAILFILPWLDTSKVRSATFRPLYKQFYWIFVVNCIALGYLGSQNPEGLFLVASRICTAYYFIHFLLVLPILGLVEKPKPIPESITKAVLEKMEIRNMKEKSAEA
jgi:ubiquinol-cytochrome c reductase cytochrome b subunit